MRRADARCQGQVAGAAVYFAQSAILHTLFGRVAQASDAQQDDGAPAGNVLLGPGVDGAGPNSLESYLAHHVENLARRFDADTYLRIVHAVNTQNVGRARRGIRAALSRFTDSALVAAGDSDSDSDSDRDSDRLCP